MDLMSFSFRRLALAALVAAAAAAGACAPAPAPVVAPGAPRYPDYVYPAPPAALGTADQAARLQDAWRFLQAGDLHAAERDFGDLLRKEPAFYPAQVGLGDVDLARAAYGEALARFESVLASAPAYAPALAGKGEALLGAGRSEDALQAFQAALAADAGLSGIRRRVEVLRFRTQEALVADARRAVDRGQLEKARQDYERALAASPDSPFLYRELAGVERTLGRLDAALTHAKKAASLDPSDAGAETVLAEVLVARREYDAALAALDRAAGIEPNDEALARRIDEVRELAANARLPMEYRAIPQAPAITRADLAALIGVRLAPLVAAAPQREGVFITDVRDSWAATWIMAVTRAGLMAVYANYTFQPGATVNRGQLAAVVSRVLGVIGRGHPALAERWRPSGRRFPDLPPSHLSYPAAAMAVAAGVIPVPDGGPFDLGRVVSGADAVSAVARLQALAGLDGR